MSNQLKIGAILSYINIIINIIIGLIYTPIMIRLLGQSEYGLYSLIGSLIGYLSILDMGLGNTIVRYTAKNRAIGDKENEKNLNGLFLLIYIMIGILTVILGSIIYFNIENMFGKTLNYLEIEKAKVMMILLIFNFSISFPLGVFASLMQAYERFVFLRICNIIRGVLNPLMVLPLLYMGYGCIMMVVIATVLNVSFLLVNVYYCFKYLNINFGFKKFDLSFLREIAGYSFFIFLNAIMDKVYWSTGQFVLGVTSGTSEVAVYAIAMQFAMMYMMFSTGISGVLLPKVTMMVANNTTNQKLTALMIKIGRLQFLLVGYMIIAFAIYGENFLFLWAGQDYVAAYPMIIIIMLALFTSLIQNTGIAILQAKNLNKFRMTVYTIIALINFLMIFPLTKFYGGIGCAISTSVALLLSTGFIMNIYYYKIGINILLFWISLKKIFCCVFAIGLIGFFISSFNLNYSWISLSVNIGIFTLIYIGVMYRYAMNSYEKNICNKFFNSLNKVLIR